MDLCILNTSAMIYCKRSDTLPEQWLIVRWKIVEASYIFPKEWPEAWSNGAQTTTAPRSALTIEIDLLQMERKGWICLTRVNGR